MVLVTSLESCRVIGAEGRQLKVIGISNATSCDDAERTNWNVKEGRRTATWEVILESTLF